MKNYILALVILLIAFAIIIYHKLDHKRSMERFSNLANNKECTILSVSTEDDSKKTILKGNASDDFVNYLLKILEIHSEKKRNTRLAAIFDYEVYFNKNDQIKFLFRVDDKGYLDFDFKDGNEGTITVDSEGANLLESYLETCFSNSENNQ